ncbi:hypothetical protein ACC668_38045, partial [Rhizobium ruizarguesonis]
VVHLIPGRRLDVDLDAGLLFEFRSEHVPMEAFLKAYLYRKDLFEDPKIKEAFKKETGKDLKPATTHAEYTEIAEFF